MKLKLKISIFFKLSQLFLILVKNEKFNQMNLTLWIPDTERCTTTVPRTKTSSSFRKATRSTWWRSATTAGTWARARGPVTSAPSQETTLSDCETGFCRTKRRRRSEPTPRACYRRGAAAARSASSSVSSRPSYRKPSPDAAPSTPASAITTTRTRMKLLPHLRPVSGPCFARGVDFVFVVIINIIIQRSFFFLLL